MVKKTKTFEGRYSPTDSEAIEWLLNLSKCFYIKKATLKSYITKTAYTKRYKCKVNVQYE